MDCNALNSSLDLPAANSTSIKLTHPRDEEAAAQIACNGEFWRGALSLEAYIRREVHLANQPATVKGGLTSWALIHNPDGPDRRFLCACESLKKKALVASKGTVKEITAHGIGSVFCPPANRGRGYADRMMKEVGERLGTWQSEEGALFSVLYSDIGKSFYAKNGWMPFPSAHVAIPAGKTHISEDGLPVTRPLRAGDLARLCADDEALIRKSLEQEALLSPDGTFIALIPNVQTIQWHHAREEFVGQELHGKLPDVKGATVGEVEGQRSWCYWTRMWYNDDPKKQEGNTLHILRIVVEDKGIIDFERRDFSEDDKNRYAPPIAALLQMAGQQAEEWGMENIEVWNPNTVTVEAAKMLDPSASVVQRDSESITSLRWYGDKTELNSLVWLGNEKYGWC